MLRRVTLVLAGVCLALAIGEVGLRLRSEPSWKNKISFGSYEWLEYDPVLGWQNHAGYANRAFRINQLHLRGNETAAHKPPGTLRIICAGDSRTFGIWLDRRGLRYDNAYSATLQRLLQDSGGSAAAEVLNAGVIGYTSAHGLRQLRTVLLTLEPDILVVGFGFNDHLLSWNTALRCAEPHAAIARMLFYDLDALRTFQVGLSLYQGLGSLHPPPLSVRWVDRDAYAYNLRRFAEISRAHGVHLVYLSQALRPIELGDSLPVLGDPRKSPTDDYGLLGVKDLQELHGMEAEYRDTLYRVAREADVPVADAAAAVAAHQGEPLFGPYDLVHPNMAGARLIAHTVYDKLAELRWLPIEARGAPGSQ